jgi:metallo-beta-lactamase class B
MSWTQPVEPFRIAGNIYYVGASDLTSFLIATPKGHILIDGGFEETAPLIRASIEKLGFRLSDVKVLLNSHAHLDHAGGLLELKQASGATFHAMPEDVAQLARGGLDDPQFGDRFPFPRIWADRLLHDRQQINLGGTVLTAHHTPGHTRGCTTYSMTLPGGTDVLFLCSPTVPSGYTIVGNPRYPDAVSDYRRHFARLRSLPCDIPLGSHGNFFQLKEKSERLRRGETAAFVDPEGCRNFIEQMENRFTTEAQRAQSSSASSAPLR